MSDGEDNESSIYNVFSKTLKKIIHDDKQEEGADIKKKETWEPNDIY